MDGTAPKREEDLSATDVYQNVTPIGATVAEISVTGQSRQRQSKLNIACHTNV